MRIQVLGVGIIILVIGGSFGAIGLSEYVNCSSSFSCASSLPMNLVFLGGVVFFMGVIVTIVGAVLGRVAPHLMRRDDEPQTVS